MSIPNWAFYNCDPAHAIFILEFESVVVGYHALSRFLVIRNNDGHLFGFGHVRLSIKTLQQVSAHNASYFGIWAEYFPGSEIPQ